MQKWTHPTPTQILSNQWKTLEGKTRIISYLLDQLETELIKLEERHNTIDLGDWTSGETTKSLRLKLEHLLETHPGNPQKG